LGPEKTEYILYRTNEQHSEDCARFPFAKIPQRVFLDTNVINVLVKHSTHVFERYPIPGDTEANLAIDIEALMHIFYVGARADWDLFGSEKVLDELARTRDENVRADLVEYALGFVNRDPRDEDRRFAADFGRRLIDTSFVAALPDIADRELIGNAIGFSCDAFCTRDLATIVNRRNRLRQSPVAHHHAR
jgi:hypothetical protein